ncbi:membrane-spanning 4-domains subfamily A member 4A-like [Embiotoca jacksoni]|uniref:membrane-spanning 4-domains subfamily A member 4A-like n=1 Tax=Embiotoca jacksoni TaxID=100190 RepID=UPI0037041522
MEGAESIARERTTEKDGDQEVEHKVVMSSKPLHRFVQKEPRSLGIVILMFGCAELLMGFQLHLESVQTSNHIYIPVWQGALFLVCGILSIYTELHPSKKMVTVCLAMYVVSLVGIIVSIVYRIICFFRLSYRTHMAHYYYNNKWASRKLALVSGIEGLLLVSSLCVSALLIFLCAIARFALKSTHTQVMIQCIPPPPQSNVTSN